MIYLLYRHPQALRQATNEAASGFTHYESVSALPFIDACINETMRLKPVAPIIILQPTRDTVVADIHLPKGTVIMCLMRAGPTDERRFPERFIVTSWEEVVEGGKRKKKRSAFYETSRLARVAKGSGRREQEVADLLNRFAMMRQMMMQIGMSTGLLGKIPGFKGLAQMQKLGGLDVNQLANLMQTPSAERGSFQAPKRNVDRAKEKRKRKDARKARKKARKRR